MLNKMTIQNKVESTHYSSFMLFLVFSYALSSISFHQLGNIFLGLLIVGTLPIFIIHKNKIFKDPIVIIFFLIIIIQIISWINSIFYLPEFANEIPKLDRLGKLFIFFFIAFWLKGSLKNIVLLWLFYIFGFILAIGINTDITSIVKTVDAQQIVDLSIKNHQWDSMLAGTALLMSLSLFYLAVKSSIFSSKLKILVLIGVSLLVLLFIYLVIVTQARQVWLGLISAIIIGPLAYFIIHKITNLKFLLVGFSLTIGLLFLFSTSSIVQERISKEQDVISSIFDKDKQIQMSSIGIRINTWIEAEEWIKKHPFIGLDSEAIPEVIQQSNRFDNNLKKNFGHLHNFFIETLVAYGFIGFFLILALYYFIIKSILSSSLSTQEKKHYLLVSIIFTTYWIVINNFETFNSRSLGVFVHNLVFASFYTFYLTDYLKTDNQST